jgi:gluconokinase
MANLGAAGSQPGRVVITVGTSGAVRITCDQPRLAVGGGTWCYLMMPQRWIAGGAINNGGLAAQWICDQFYMDQPQGTRFEVMMAEAEAIAPGAEGLIVLPYFTGERSPSWQPKARAAFVGLSLLHRRAHMARATLEGVAFCLADVWDALQLEPDALTKMGAVRLTGGIVHSPVWCRIIADVLGMRIIASEEEDASALGAARTALVSAGLRPAASLEEVPVDQPSVQFLPDMRYHTTYVEIRKRFQALARQVVFTKSEG